MARKFRLPSIGDAHTEAEVREWHVEVGDQVELDQPLVDIETAKATVEIPSPFAGTLLARFGEQDDVIAVGDLLAVIGEPGESWDPRDGEAGTLSPAQAANVGPERTPVPNAPPRDPVGQRIAPIARKLAAEHDIDLARVSGTGPGGRITKADVVARIEALGRDRKGEPPATHTTGQTTGDKVRLSTVRRTIAANLTESWSAVPHSCAFYEIDATELLARQARFADTTGRVSIDALFVELVAGLLGDFPDFNSFVDGEDVVRSSRRNIGVAIDAPQGLMVATVNDADRSSVRTLAANIADLAARVRAGDATPSELSGSTFTISNIGAAGGTYVTPILPPRTSALLSIGRAADAVVPVDGAIAIRPMIALSLAFDHRLIDGAAAVRFLAQLQARVEAPSAPDSAQRLG